MNVSCQCGAISFTTPTPKPIKIFHCHCLDCRKQSSSAFGTSAIFPFFRLPLDNPSLSHLRRTCDSGNQKNCYFCSRCGSRVAHVTVRDDGADPEVMSIKAGLVDGLDWTGATHIYVRSAVVPIPEGVERWEAEPPSKGKA
ncbi:hypothetical protein K505DRAFT_348337 [Melanomma pulvis-pyrius CBS 109.77]|uniref:CENP-V/GFA domain-containing protein n=1 Tax=Melanomma pulvis-pyrius CBS 109.77 TaxID=1314802 RepID=A0A6A6XHI4_9PLEO|nr:hypothetical protein K505DRAFT_348337 [Melanomma pulvis-pyrius CBS 109.77]